MVSKFNSHTEVFWQHIRYPLIQYKTLAKNLPRTYIYTYIHMYYIRIYTVKSICHHGDNLAPTCDSSRRQGFGTLARCKTSAARTASLHIGVRDNRPRGHKRSINISVSYPLETKSAYLQKKKTQTPPPLPLKSQKFQVHFCF